MCIEVADDNRERGRGRERPCRVHGDQNKTVQVSKNQENSEHSNAAVEDYKQAD